MAFMKTNTVDITVSGKKYNSLTDFGLAISNTDYLGEPVQGTANLVSVPGRSGMLDTTDTVFGGQYFSHRRIKISFGGIEEPQEWDSVISQLRNLFEGKIAQLRFATDPDWYWTGRVSIEKFAHNQSLGEFNFCINYADPFKYRPLTSVQMWAANTSSYKYYTVQVHRDGIPMHFELPANIQGYLYVEYGGDVFTFEAGTSDTEIILNTADTIVGVKSLWSGSTGNYVTASYQDRSL